VAGGDVVIRTVGALVSVAVAAGGLAWAGNDLLSGGTLAHALADGNVRSFDAAADQFRRNRPGAEAALAAQRGDAQLRARADTMLGVLAVRDALAHPAQAAAALAAAMTAFRSALVLDPANEEAATNLELLYLRRHGRRSPARGGHGQTRPPNAKGSVTPGSAAPSSTGGGY
jgi:hypothetical protein